MSDQTDIKNDLAKMLNSTQIETMGVNLNITPYPPHAVQAVDELYAFTEELEPLRPMASNMHIIEAALFSTFMALCICMTLVGNILVVISVFTYRPLRNVANFFIVSLAVADMAVSILVMPFNTANFIIGYWVFGPFFCNIWLTCDILICTASILNLCAIAMDRYYAIHDPLHYASKRTMKRVLVIIALVWGLSAIISIPPLFGWNNSSGHNLYNSATKTCQLTDARGFVIYSALGSFFIPLIVMTFVYAKIFQATRRRLRERSKAAAAARLAAISMTNNAKCTTKCTNVTMPQDTSSTDSPDEHHDSSNNGNAGGNNIPPNGATSIQPTLPNNNSPSLAVNKNDLDVKLKLVESHSVNFDESRKTSECERPLTEKDRRGTTRNKTFQVSEFLEERQRISLSRERRAARTMGIIMGCFVLCWLPFFLMYIIFPFCEACARTDPRIVNAIVWLGYLNSSLNPVIYTVFNIDFRRSFKRILQGHCRHR